MENKRRGRPTKPVNPTTCDRISRLRGRESRTTVAAALNIDAQSLARYEKGERAAPDWVLKEMSKYWKVPIAYLKGETDKLTEAEYQAELIEKEMAEIPCEGMRTDREQIKALFSAVGYVYTFQVPGPSEFQGVFGEEQTLCPHTITNVQNASDFVGYTDEEFEKVYGHIVDVLRDAVELEMYRKQAKEKALHSD